MTQDDAPARARCRMLWRSGLALLLGSTLLVVPAAAVSATPAPGYDDLAAAVRDGKVEPAVIDDLADGAATILGSVVPPRAAQGNPVGSAADRAEDATAAVLHALPEGDRVVTDHDHAGIRVVRVSSAAEVLEFANDDAVDQVMANVAMSPENWGETDELGDPESLDMIRQPQALTYRADGHGVTSYVIDDGGNHGENVTAIVGSVAPEADVVWYRGLLSTQIAASFDSILARLRNGERGVSLNMSFSGPLTCDSYATQLSQMRGYGLVPVASAGNDGRNSSKWPACSAQVMSVGATWDSDVGRYTHSVCENLFTGTAVPTCWSNYPDDLDIWAPGAWAHAGGHRMHGTSQASPHVAGAIAAIASHQRTASAAALQRSIVVSNESATKGGVSAPVLDMMDALHHLLTGNRQGEIPAEYLLPDASEQHLGDISGDGRDDVLIAVEGSVVSYPMLGTTTRGQLDRGAQGHNYSVGHQWAAGDFNADGLGDMNLNNSNVAKDFWAWGQEGSTAPRFGVYSSATELTYQGLDFDGDGAGDLYAYHPANDRADSLSYGAAGQPFTSVRSLNTEVWGDQMAAGDFDGDGDDDLFFYGPGTRRDRILLGSPSRTATPTQVAVTMSHLSARPAVGDFNGDGRDDIYWYGNGAAADEVWFGSAVAGQFAVQASPIARNEANLVVAAADLDDDGRDDVWFYNPNGDEWVFYSDGTNRWDEYRVDFGVDGRNVQVIS